MRTLIPAAAFLVVLVAGSRHACAASLGTAFTYRGQLEQSSGPVTDTCDFEFSLWGKAGTGSPPTGGNQIGSTQTLTGVPVTSDLFTVEFNGGRDFYWDASSEKRNNNATVYVPDSRLPAGRWKRLVGESSALVKWFGPYGDAKHPQRGLRPQPNQRQGPVAWRILVRKTRNSTCAAQRAGVEVVGTPGMCIRYPGVLTIAPVATSSSVPQSS